MSSPDLNGFFISSRSVAPLLLIDFCKYHANLSMSFCPYFKPLFRLLTNSVDLLYLLLRMITSDRPARQGPSRTSSQNTCLASSFGCARPTTVWVFSFPYAPCHLLYFFPDPQGHGLLRPISLSPLDKEALGKPRLTACVGIGWCV